ncbi:sensor histidine kinase [Scleromatobacter humisilvae]|uniref:Histidine kinase n=1 Tax=Scleromatobacter humisilvae TaxID=2897159 RepID=A0A9X2C2B8_9BURK|nr:histidine kinase [Scleromatobacter humisilvae]MCK9686659.1 histidine kinase [Scleromatobacter humisilvae]
MTSRDIRRPPSRWLWIAGIWAGVGLVDATQTVISMRSMGMHHAWVRLFVFELLAWLPWTLATPFVMALQLRRPLAPRRGFVAALGLHGAAWFALAAASALWIAVSEHALNPWSPDTEAGAVQALFGRRMHDQLLSSLFIYYCILMAGHALHSRDKLARERAVAAELAEQLAQARLDALRHQIAPHFLFNALNAISGMVREQRAAQAVETIARISEFLRHSLHDGGAQEVALDEELHFASLYLDIQKMRFEDRLAARIGVAPELGRALVPRLILQPLVENAVKHGIAMRVQPGAVEIAASRTPTALVLEVYNDGPAIAANDAVGPAAATAPRTGSIGLANVRNRLQGLYGGEATLDVSNVDGRGVKVTIHLPWREAAA